MVIVSMSFTNIKPFGKTGSGQKNCKTTSEPRGGPGKGPTLATDGNLPCFFQRLVVDPWGNMKPSVIRVYNMAGSWVMLTMVENG